MHTDGLKAVQETRNAKEEAVQFLAEYRELSSDVFGWMIDTGLIALYASERTSLKTGDKRDDIEIAFPVMTDVSRLPIPPTDSERFLPKIAKKH